MKSFTDLFIKRPVLAMVVSFVILIAGLQAMKTINVRQYPRSDIAAITVTTVYVGADAELVRGFITTPLERAIAAADGIDYIQSQSQQSQSVITARLKLNYDANKALSDISSKVDAIRRDLPPEAEIPVIAIQAADSQFASSDCGRRRAKGGHSWRTDVCHAHLDEARADGGIEHQPGGCSQRAHSE